MKEKDFKNTYEDFYNKNLEQYIEEVEELYKQNKEEGDAELYSFNSCLKLLTEKKVNLKIKNSPYNEFYSIFKERNSLVQNNNLYRLYINHIIPKSQVLKIKMNENLFSQLLNEFAVNDASTKVYSWFSSWHTIYKMMFELNDFSEFKLYKNCNYSESLEVFKKYQKRLNPNRYTENKKKEINSAIKIDFDIKKEFKDKFKNLYEELTISFINEKKTSEKDFENVFLLNGNIDKSKIYFFCDTEPAAYLLRELEYFFKNLTFTNIEHSKLLISKRNKVLRQKNLSNSLTAFNKKIEDFDTNSIIQEVNNILNMIK